MSRQLEVMIAGHSGPQVSMRMHMHRLGGGSAHGSPGKLWSPGGDLLGSDPSQAFMKRTMLFGARRHEARALEQTRITSILKWPLYHGCLYNQASIFVVPTKQGTRTGGEIAKRGSCPGRWCSREIRRFPLIPLLLRVKYANATFEAVPFIGTQGNCAPSI